MILVENRELLIPNNERYIGTTKDSESENRLFRIRRRSQSGVDMANLTFRLDLKYPEGRQVYSFDIKCSRAGKIVLINANTWTKQYSDAGTYTIKYNGTNWICNNQTVSLAQIGVSIYFTPASGDTITVTVTITQAAGDTVLLDKEVTDEYINLTWHITASQLEVPGSVLISLRGTDETATVRWASYQAAIFVEKNGYLPSDYNGKLSELEQLENLLSKDIADIENAVQGITAYTYDSEAWAVGTRNGTVVKSSDETYKNNSKYYAQLSENSASNAANSATAAQTAQQNAEKIIDDASVSSSRTYSSEKITKLVPTKVSQLTNDSKFVNQTQLTTAAGKWAQGTLAAGETQLTIACAGMTADSTVSIFTSVWGVNPSWVEATTDAVALTFAAQEDDIQIKVRWQ